MMKHANIPIFIPHLGCPNDCVFCNQRRISGKLSFDEKTVKSDIENALSTIDTEITETEIAYFGGSFTGIDRSLMIYLLGVAKEFCDRGLVSSVRVSTRPDYIDGEILAILGRYGVRTVELGIQSMSDSVLRACRRGHSTDDTRRACRMVTEAGFSLVGQMMIGLPGSSGEDETQTAEYIACSGADSARVYPTVVFRGTALCDMAQNGEYTPLDEQNAVERTKNVLDVFDRTGIRVIRVGLVANENLESDEAVFGGASQSAVGEMAMSALFLDRICARLDNTGAYNGKILTVEAPAGSTSKAVGHRRRNAEYLRAKYGIKNLKVVENSALTGYNIRIV